MMNEALINWLLEENNAPVRYRTMTALLDIPGDDPRVVETKARIPDDRKVKRIFKHMHPDGYWLHRGKGATIDVNHNADYCIVVDANYVIIRGLTLREAKNSIIYINSNRHHILIEENDMSMWGTGSS